MPPKAGKDAGLSEEELEELAIRMLETEIAHQEVCRRADEC